MTLTRDARLGCGRVMELGVDVAMRMGFRVFLRAEPISTPQSYFTTLYVSQEHRKTMGLAITASHNPAQYVGIKFTVPIVHEEFQGIRITPNVYTTLGELDRFCELMETIARRGLPK